MGKNCTACCEDGVENDLADSKRSLKKNKKPIGGAAIAKDATNANTQLDFTNGQNVQSLNQSKENNQISINSTQTHRIKQDIGNLDSNGSKLNGDSIQDAAHVKMDENLKGSDANPVDTSNLKEVTSQSMQQKNVKALDISEPNHLKNIGSKQSFDFPMTKDIQPASDQISGNVPLSTINVDQQATGSQHMAGDIEQESEMTHLEADPIRNSQTDKDQKQDVKSDEDKESKYEKKEVEPSDDKDQYEVDFDFKKQKTQEQAAQKDGLVTDGEKRGTKVFQSSTGSKEDDDIDDVEMLHGSIMMNDTKDEDELSKLEDNNAPPAMKSIKKVRTETMRQPIRKSTLAAEQSSKFDDGTSDASYMVRVPNNPRPQVPDDLTSQGSYMVKFADNRMAQQFDQSSVAGSSVMMKGGAGASDVFDGQSMADSDVFMRKEPKIMQGMSMGEGSEMMRGDPDNKVFDDVTSQGTFMGKGQPIKVMDDNGSEASSAFHKATESQNQMNTDKDFDAESDVQMTKE